MTCSYSLWEVALTYSFMTGAGFAVVASCVYLYLKRIKDENGRVGRDSKGRFVKLK
jgi:hypothetical protein